MIAIARVGVPFLGGVLVTALLAAQAPVAKEEPAYRSLDANLFMQTSAEYRAACYQAFALAELRLGEKLKAKPAGGKPAAVVLDLDETVLDNGAFQAAQIQGQFGYDQARWNDYEKNGAATVRLVPGAKEFLLAAQKLGVAWAFISNRGEANRDGTKAVLALHGLGVPENQLLLATTTSDKTARRATAAEAFDVLLYCGDNLRDFDEGFKFDKVKGIDGRKAVADAHRAKFGAEWIVLPNPAYGEWAKALAGTKKDAELLK